MSTNSQPESPAFSIHWKDLAKMFVGMVVAATIPVTGAMLRMWGDMIEIKAGVTSHGETLRDHGQRISTIERSRAKEEIEK